MPSRLLALFVLGSLLLGSPGNAAEPPAVDFTRDVKPILVARCYRCHSSLEQEGALRLDSSAAILKGGDGGSIVVPGKSKESRLIAVVTKGGDVIMPPEGEPLTTEQIDKLAAWIDAGAHLPNDDQLSERNHWSFQKPVRPTIPTVPLVEWSTNPIDALVAAKHVEHQLAPTAEAPKNLLLRRVYLDLIGLPPTPDELQAFANDNSPAAYERVVDRLLASPQYGERWGRHWMDVWRYSDWDGYGNEIRESQRHIWRWREWIVESLNADKPYDRMVQEMLAADELAPDDVAALRATGYLARSWYKFNRNKWLDDTVEHTGKAFLGVTFNCCRCHDHMYDPLQQREYYSLRAVFEPYEVRTDRVRGQSNIELDGMVRAFDAKAEAETFLFVRGNEKDPRKEDPLSPAVPAIFRKVPFVVESVTLPSAAYYPGLNDFIRNESLADAKTAIEKAATEHASAVQAVATAKQLQTDYLAKQTAATENKMAPAEPWLVDDFAKRNDALWKLGAGVWEHQAGQLQQSDPRDELCGLTTVQAHPHNFVARFRLKITGGDVYKSVGLAFDVRDAANFQSVYVSAHGPGPHLLVRAAGVDSYPESSPKTTAVEVGQTYELQVAVRDKLANVWLNGQRVLAYSLPAERIADGSLMLWTYDATAEFLDIAVDTLPSHFELVDKLDGAAAPTSAEQFANAIADAEHKQAIAQQGLGVAQAAHLALEARLAADTAHYSHPPAGNVKELSLAAGAAERKHAHQQAEFALLQAQQNVIVAKRALRAGDKATEKAAQDAETALATAQQAKTAAEMATTVPTETYTRITPVYPNTSTGRRLALARWITARDNPLAARMAANQIWMRHLGTPLVSSVFDFGLNGKPASNQPLLDWLAVELMENGWRMKPLHKQIVMSRTYRLASTASDNAAQTANAKLDPENLYYWRANTRRLEAEIVRDATLHVAGSLDTSLGGPDLDQADGLTSPRRSLYFRATKEKKVEFLSLFDSANPVECYRRSESIAPQQALAMANSTLTLAQSRILARKLSTKLAGAASDQSPALFIAAAFQQILCREATESERAACAEFLISQAARFADAKSLTLFEAGPQATVAPADDPQQRARESLVHVLLNHNDFVTIR